MGGARFSPHRPARKDIKDEKKSKLTRNILNRWQLYLLLLLPLIYVILFKYVPMVGNILAFKKYEVGKSIWDMEWVGLANFKRFFANYKFSQIIKNALTLALYNVIVTFPIPILFALFINAFP